MRIGVLALQGDFSLHAAALARCGAEAVEVSPAVVAGVIRPSAAVAGLARAVRAGTTFRTIGMCVATTVLAVPQPAAFWARTR